MAERANVSELLIVDELAANVAGIELLTRVSFSLADAECLGVVGETGSGKTLTSRALTGTLPHIGGSVTRGTMRFRGLPLETLSPSEWRRLRGRKIALVPQSSLSGLNPVRRVGGQLVETVRLIGDRKGARRRAIELLEQVALPDPERAFASYPHQLSGGMRQRVMIALAIAGRPELLIADEPTTALDVTVQREILDLLTALRLETGLSIIFVTHDLSVIHAISQSVAIMYAGMTVEYGATQDVLVRPRHPYTRALVAARPTLVTTEQGERVRGIPGRPPSPDEWPSGCRFSPRCPYSVSQCDAGLPELQSIAPRSGVACIREEEISRGVRERSAPVAPSRS